MLCNHDAGRVKTYNVTEIETTNTTAALYLDGVFPACLTNFAVRLHPCANYACSGLMVTLVDCAGTTLNLWNRKANRATLGQVNVQAARHACLHVTRSTDNETSALWQEWPSCAPTPVVAARRNKKDA